MSKKQETTRLTSFPAVVGENPHTLILGSMPGKRSLDEQRYYAFPQNAFWRIMGSLCGFDPGEGYNLRLDALKRSGFALWDVLQNCEREGSLDSSIALSSEVPNRIIEFLERYESIGRVCFNGGKAETSFRRHLLANLPDDKEITLVRLPSTSPAYAGMRYEEKLAIWRDVLAN